MQGTPYIDKQQAIRASMNAGPLFYKSFTCSVATITKAMAMNSG